MNPQIENTKLQVELALLRNNVGLLVNELAAREVKIAELTAANAKPAAKVPGSPDPAAKVNGAPAPAAK